MAAHDELLRAAVDIARAASGRAAQRFLEGVPVSRKTDGTEVTPADIEVEELIRSLIAARFPGDGVAGEELQDTPGTQTATPTARAAATGHAARPHHKLYQLIYFCALPLQR